MIRGALGAIAALLFIGTAQAQTAAPQPAPAPVEQAKEVTSKLAGATFLYPAFTLTDDGMYRDALDAIAGIEKGKCGDVEGYGWTYDSKDIGQAIITATMHDLEKAGYRMTIVPIKEFKDKSVFPSYALGPKNTLLLMWVVDDDASQMIMCEVH